MRKIFGKKGDALTKPTPLPVPSTPIAADANTTPTPTTTAAAAQQAAQDSKPLPAPPKTLGKRPTPLPTPSSHARPSFQQPRPAARGTSGDDLNRPLEVPQKRDSTWVVVDAQPPPQLQSQPPSSKPPRMNNGAGAEYNAQPGLVSVVSSPNHNPNQTQNPPGFESRSSSASVILSLPPGASPPLPYQGDPVSSPLAAAAAAPPSIQGQSQTPSTGSRRSDASRRLSQAPLHPYNGMSMLASASAENVYEPSEASDGVGGRERHQHEKGEKGWKGIFAWADRDKQRERERERAHLAQNNASMHGAAPEPNEPRWDITRTVGYVTATGSEDWTLLLDVCERASTESGAKEAAKALRNEFKYAEPSPMLSAARLWAVMLRNCQAPFLQQSSSKKFIDTVEDCVISHNTSPVVRERLLLIIGGAAAQHGDQYPAFRALWRKVKHRSAPKNGIPFDPKDAMFSPPTRRLPKPGSLNDGVNGGRPHSVVNVNVNVVTGPISPEDDQATPLQTMPIHDGQYPPRRDSHEARIDRDRGVDSDREVPRSERNLGSRGRPAPPPLAERHSRGGFISPQEDIRRLFEECELARGNAQMLSNALVFAKPEDVLNGSAGVITEFHTSCCRSKEIIETQIPWATAGADRSRMEQQQRGRNKSQQDLTSSSPPTVTVEEQLLAALLHANQDLTEALREYDDVISLGASEREEREVRERSRKETRLDRTQIQYYDPNGSFITEPPGGGARSGPSRSPSPSKQVPPVGRSSHPLPTPPAGNTPQFIPPHLPPSLLSQQQHPNGSSNTLAPPPPAPVGPRQPSLINGANQSRSQSPDSVRMGADHNVTPAVTAPPHERAASSGARAMESLKRGMGKLGLDVHRSGSVKKKKAGAEGFGMDKEKSREREMRMDGLMGEDGEGEDQVAREPTAKALGKRRAEPYAEDEAFDPDDLFKERPETPLGQEDDPLHSDSDSMVDGVGHIHSHSKSKTVVYAYDAAAEKEKERRQIEMAVKSQPVESIG